MQYLIYFIISLILSIVLTVVIKKIALKLNIIDLPNEERKIHIKGIPLLGGIAIFLSFFITLFFVSEKILAGDLNPSHLLGFFIGALVLIIGGFLDDKFNLPAKVQIIFPILAILSIILGGVEIEKITNPLGGFIHIGKLLSIILITSWLLVMMYTTKILDGIDGLVSGVGAIGGIIIFLFTITTKYFQPDIALVSIIFTGALLGFLIFNWHPAKIFLGEGGALLIGFILGVLAIISGGKIAIALLVLGVPILDVFWTILRRLFKKQNPFKFSDNLHLHHRLMDLGLTQRKTALVFYFLAFSFGISGLFLQSLGKVMAILILIIIMFLFIIIFSYLDNKKSNLEISRKNDKIKL